MGLCEGGKVVTIQSFNLHSILAFNLKAYWQ